MLKCNFLFGLLIAVCCSLFYSCNDNKSGSSVQQPSTEGADTMAVMCYKMQVNGQFDNLVNAMHSCDGSTKEYKERMVMMLRQHQKKIIEEKKGINNVVVLRTEMHNNNHMANVFLNVSYKDNSQEEIIMPMVYDGKQWRMQ